MMNLHSRLQARLKGTCFISVDASGNVTGSAQPVAMTSTAGGDTTANEAIPEVSAEGAPRDPGGPAETEAEKTARLAAETPEQKTAREAAEAEAAVVKDKTTEEETPEAKAAREAAEAETANKAWLDRDKAKDVPVSDDQKAEIAKLAATPEQAAALEEFTLETNTTNNLSPASRAKAAQVWGVKPEMVDRYVASVIAQNDAVKAAAGAAGGAPAAQQYDDASEDPAKWSPAMQGEFKSRMDALEAVAGGKDQWASFAEWADTNLSAGDKQALQQAISASPVVGATVAKEHLARWKAEGNGGGPLDLSRGAGHSPNLQAQPQGFASRQEQNAAISDPRYAKDEGYRASVDARIIATNFSSKPAVESAFYRGAGSMMGT